ncbi:MAG: phosphoribosyl-AMP cyclohydrolase [Desulfobacteraceae bacterium 4572_19]|nr:MAG: phosphoribosyl-AMP cyclohydrolase [Desulfobacteraceae bacterium 4572_19]
MIKLDFNKGNGLLPVIVQEYKTKEVLMLAYMNEEAWQVSLDTSKATYYSRSRKSLWVKGETSGNVQIIKEIRFDCDNDTILLKVEQTGGAACHKGYRSCFFNKINKDGLAVIDGEKIFNPEDVY